MKGRFKDRAKQITLIVLFLIISVITISLIAGRINTQEVLLVKKDGLQYNVPLEEQLEFFEKKEFLKSELKYFKGSIVTNEQQLKGKIISYDLKAGNPIPLSSLKDQYGAGQFAAVMPKGRTVHLLSQAMLGLPPLQKGDVINIALTYKEKLDDNTEAIRVGMLMTNVKIYNIVENNIYVDVDLQQDLVLSTAAQLGTFIYQIPGQQTELCGEESENCSTEEISPEVVEQSDIFEAIINKTYSSQENIDKAIGDSDTSADEISNNIVTPSSDKDSEDEEDKGNEEENGNSDDTTGGENVEQQN